MWIAIAISGFFLVMLINGMIQQERYRLFRKYQDKLVEQQKAAMEEQKRLATGKIKEMLRERRSEAVANDTAGESAPNAAAPQSAATSPAPTSSN